MVTQTLSLASTVNELDISLTDHQRTLPLTGLSTSTCVLLWLVIALHSCVQWYFDMHPLVPPLDILDCGSALQMCCASVSDEKRPWQSVAIWWAERENGLQTPKESAGQCEDQPANQQLASKAAAVPLQIQFLALFSALFSFQPVTNLHVYPPFSGFFLSTDMRNGIWTVYELFSFFGWVFSCSAVFPQDELTSAEVSAAERSWKGKWATV